MIKIKKMIEWTTSSIMKKVFGPEFNLLAELFVKIISSKLKNNSFLVQVKQTSKKHCSQTSNSKTVKVYQC